MPWLPSLSNSLSDPLLLRGGRGDGASQRAQDNSNPNGERPAQLTYGYHNTFHTHAAPSVVESAPPSYDATVSSRSHRSQCGSAQEQDVRNDVLPEYSCTIQLEGALAVKCELASPFLESVDQRWHDVYAVLCGTQLCIYRLKSASLRSANKNKPREVGRLFRKFTLQHAEVGLAVDHKVDHLVPKSSFVKLVPPSARQRLWETDPQLFEPPREWVLRLRLETEQILLCLDSQEDMLDWVEKLCAAIDIAPPLEDRCEPRYRSLPRRNRRQHQIEGLFDQLDTLREDSVGRRLIEQQERLFRRLYPRLADTSEERETGDQEQENEAALLEGGRDPDAEDLDPADVAEGSRPGTSRPSSNRATPTPGPSDPEDASSSSTRTTVGGYDPKTAVRVSSHSHSSLMRYRRRCAPILLYTSPRASEVLFSNGKRTRIDTVTLRLASFELLPPRYEAGSHTLARKAMAAVLADGAQDGESTATIGLRPTLDRGVSEVSYASASSNWAAADGDIEQTRGGRAERGGEGEEEASIRSASAASSNIDVISPARSLDRIDSAMDSETSVPPSPTTATAPSSAKGKDAVLVVTKKKAAKLQHTTPPSDPAPFTTPRNPTVAV